MSGGGERVGYGVDCRQSGVAAEAQPRRFRKLPIVIEAMRLPVWSEATDVADYLEIAIRIGEWCGGRSHMMLDDDEEVRGVAGPHIVVTTIEGAEIPVRPGNWIIRGALGEFYPCDAEAFEQTYEAEAESGVGNDA